jgi:hypothetical protein
LFLDLGHFLIESIFLFSPFWMTKLFSCWICTPFQKGHKKSEHKISRFMPGFIPLPLQW